MLKLNRKVAALKPSATLAADAHAKELRAAGIDVISLDAGEPDFDTPDRIKQAARRALAEGQTKYTPVAGIRPLKEAICRKLKGENGLEYSPAEVIASAGAKQAEYNVIAALLDEGDEVILPIPAWVSFVAMVQMAGASVRTVECRERDGFRLEPEALRRAINPRTRAVMLNSPCNPTGAVLRAEHLGALAAVLRETDLWVMSDDVYEHMIYDGRVPHLFALEPRLRPRAIIFNSLSKTYAMTGWRIGYAAGPAEVIAAAVRLQSQNSGNPNSIAQAAAVEALSGPQDEVGRMVVEFDKRRRFVVERLRAIPGLALPNLPEGAFYVFPNVSALLGKRWQGGVIRDGDGVAEMLLEEARVSVVGGNDFGAPDHIRISYAASLAKLEEGFNRIEHAVRALEG